MITRELLRLMPKTELHLHLDGSLRPKTALELARERGIDAIRTLDEARTRLQAPERCTDQADLLRAFDLPVEIMQDAESLRRITAELVEDVAAQDRTRYVEIRWAPSLHVRRGLPLVDGIAAVVAGARDGAAAVERAADPAPGAPRSAAGGAPALPERGVPAITVRLIAVAMRTQDAQTSAEVAQASVQFAGSWLTGFDLAGPEAAAPDPLVHARAFEIARDAGLGITIHAGEWGGAAQVARALAVSPARIAHGAPAIDDPDVVAALVDRNVTLDLSPVSNVQAAMVARLADHPLPRLLRAGVPVTLSTDDRTVAGVTLVGEYENAVDVLGLSPRELWRVDRHGLEAAFLEDEALRARLLAEFDAFGAAHGLA